MDPSTLLNRPKTFNITPKITKINNLAIASGQARKSSSKLVKVFEKGTYQKKTQLSVLNRYKKRLESIQKQNDRSFGRKRKVKLKMPDIKKYVGNFFTPGSANDPLKAIGALAAFTALQKGSKGDWGGALGSGLVAAGLLGGGALAFKGIRSALPGKNAPAATPQMGVPGASAGSFFGTPYAQTKAGKSYASMQQFRNLPQWAKGLSSSSASRFSASNERIIQGTANIGDRLRVGTRGLGMQGVGGMAENLATSGPPKITPRVGLLNAALFGLDYMGRKSEGQSNLQAGVGAGAGVGGALLGAAIGTMLFPGVGTVAGLLIGAAFSTGGALIASAIADKATGVEENKLKKQTEQQKALVDKKKEEKGKLTFSKTLNSYGKAISKFEEFSKGFVGGMGFNSELMEGGNITPPPPSFNPYTGPISKDSFFPLPGGTLSTRQVGVPGGEYGAGRSYGGHSGQDIGGLNPGSPVVAWKTGTVTIEPGYEGGDNVVTIDHGGGVKTVYKHVVATVRNGDTVYGGQQIASLYASKKWEPHLHFEVWNGNSHINPNSNLSASQRISSPMTIDRAKEISSKNSTPQSITPTGAPPGTPETLSPLFQRQTPQGMSPIFQRPGVPAASLSQARPRQMPQISQQLSYQEGYTQAQPMVVPYPIVRQQQASAPAASAPMMLPGPSEQQLLNSFYKKVLLNTVQ
jgi:murein DD-endopeptidase MepM/ murein hydrolase activator NlpD